MRVNDQKLAPAEAFLFILSSVQKQYRFDAVSFMEKRNISLEDLHQKNAKIPAFYVNELIDEAIALFGDAALLFKFAQSVTPNKLGVLGYLMLHSSSVEDAIVKLSLLPLGR